ncbi:hypothetical protein HMPREF9062_0527 [Actinomyces sp. oral taxon 448 str. F0400]|nr:hypothetical protein HMPREF9062_0527 [Actinomyces sp. oral taxon 448 str. F0400]
MPVIRRFRVARGRSVRWIYLEEVLRYDCAHPGTTARGAG